MTAPREVRCDLTDLPAAFCAHCLGHTLPAGTYTDDDAPDDARLPVWFAAEWPGKCVCCGDEFKPGTQIRRATTGRGWQCCEEGT